MSARASARTLFADEEKEGEEEEEEEDEGGGDCEGEVRRVARASSASCSLAGREHGLLGRLCAEKLSCASVSPRTG